MIAINAETLYYSTTYNKKGAPTEYRIKTMLDLDIKRGMSKAAVRVDGFNFYTVKPGAFKQLEKRHETCGCVPLHMLKA